MSEMVERVARALASECAICKAHGLSPTDLISGTSDPRGTIYVFEAYEAQARAAIAAMREPTEAMVSAGYIQLNGERFLRPREPANAWPAMIDAALEEKP